MEPLALDVRLDGYDDPVGFLVRHSRGAVAFASKEEYVSAPDPTPLSLSLPLSPEPHEDVVTRAFFDNLLHERDSALADIMAREGLSRDDIAGLLFHLGKDCAGALSVLPIGGPPGPDIGGYNYKTFQGSLLWTPTDNFEAEIGLYVSDDQIDNSPQTSALARGHRRPIAVGRHAKQDRADIVARRPTCGAQSRHGRTHNAYPEGS